MKRRGLREMAPAAAEARRAAKLAKAQRARRVKLRAQHAKAEAIARKNGKRS